MRNRPLSPLTPRPKIPAHDPRAPSFGPDGLWGRPGTRKWALRRLAIGSRTASRDPTEPSAGGLIFINYWRGLERPFIVARPGVGGGGADLRPSWYKIQKKSRYQSQKTSRYQVKKRLDIKAKRSRYQIQKSSRYQSQKTLVRCPTLRFLPRAKVTRWQRGLFDVLLLMPY